MNYKALIFDFFGVICSEVSPHWLRKYLPEAEALTVKSSLVHEADVGALSQDELFSELSRRTNVAPGEIEREWMAHARIDPLVTSLIASLRGHCIIGLLTNSPAPFFRRILQENELSSLFDAIVVSSEIKIAKPAPGAYLACLDALGVEASEVLFIDDNPLNIAGAESVGIAALLFQSAEQLSRDLPKGATER